jgi:hypothetical protein
MQPGAIVPPSKSQIQQEMLSASYFQHMDEPTNCVSLLLCRDKLDNSNKEYNKKIITY